MSTHKSSISPKILIDLPDTMSAKRQAAFVSAFDNEAAKQCGVPTLTVDMDKHCRSCGRAGATPSGLCMRCGRSANVPHEPLPKAAGGTA
jgi:hypothetical protein